MKMHDETPEHKSMTHFDDCGDLNKNRQVKRRKKEIVTDQLIMKMHDQTRGHKSMTRFDDDFLRLITGEALFQGELGRSDRPAVRLVRLPVLV